MRALVLLLLLTFPLQTFARASLLEDLREPSELRVKSLPLRLDVIPRGARRVKLLSLQLRASCEDDVKLKYLRVHRIGLGDAADIQGVYLMHGFRRLSRRTRISSDQTALLRMRHFLIPACETKTLDVAVDFKSTAASGGRFALSIESIDDIVSDAGELEVDFPLRSFLRSADVSPESDGEVTITFQSVPGTITAIRDEVLARFIVEASNDKHQVLHAITLTNKGNMRGDEIRNIYLTRNRGRALTPIAKELDRDQVTLRFSHPYFLRRGQKVRFELRGQAWRRNKTINFTLEEPSDLVARSSSRRGRRVGPQQGINSPRFPEVR